MKPKLADASEYKQLFQIPYDSAWMKYFNFGSHTGAMSPSFARHFLAPLLVRDEHPERAQARISAPDSIRVSP